MWGNNNMKDGTRTMRIQVNEALNQAIRDGDAFLTEDGQVFIGESFIRNGEKYGWKIGSLIPKWSDELPQQDIVTDYAISISIDTPESEEEKLISKIREVIRKEIKPGGIIHRHTSGR
jgi:hypothetical protein